VESRQDQGKWFFPLRKKQAVETFFLHFHFFFQSIIPFDHIADLLSSTGWVQGVRFMGSFFF